MLPELLFSGGTSMQDITRDELTLLQTGCDKESILSSNEATFDRIKLGRTPDLMRTDLEPLPVSIKLEDAADAYHWHTTKTDIGSNLLRHSDDPLISSAVDNNQNEFDSIANCETLSSIEAVTPSTSCAYKKPARTRKKGQVKLRFHHQALPQEYLEHFEATQNHEFSTKEISIGMQAKLKRNSPSVSCSTATASTAATTPIFPTTPTTVDSQDSQKINESVQMWLQNVSEFQENNDNPLIDDGNGVEKVKSSSATLSPANKQQSNSRVVTFNDLPYMGEMTLENSKPRRGRKPKKADICHLIYKNYGTVFPNQKTEEQETTTEVKKTATQNKIISSLLEKRLTQIKANKAREDQNEQVETAGGKKGSEEPLNLCVRDRYDDIMTVISSEDTNDCERLSELKPDVSLVSSEDASSLFSSNLKMELPNFQTALLDNNPKGSTEVGDLLPSQNFNYWSNSGMFLNPMALYLQKIANASSDFVQNQANETSSTSSLSPNVAECTKEPEASRTRHHQSLLIPKKMSQLLRTDVNSRVNGRSSEKLLNSTVTNTKSTSNQKSSASTPPKRKRSAIFIPPLPEESSTNHATEVSICKFKFTGGAKPSLQEKKMLSVDAGGNFRYYSGTGDKSIRGYEFFPRESLQQSSLMAASSAGAFLNTTGQKIADLPPPSLGLSNEILQIPEISPQNAVGIMSSTASVVASPSFTPTQQLKSLQLSPAPQHYRNDRTSSSIDYHNRRKRKSKRSMQREKLEKTFKEKGFLIQTQQLESAEGATYCKFRQLRKFTRYLFRSWKDYLPGELQHNQGPSGNTQEPSGSIEMHPPIIDHE